MGKKLNPDESLPPVATGILIHGAALRWQSAADTVVSEWGLTVTQYALLWGVGVLTRSQQPITQAQLARQVGTDVMLTSKHVRELEAKLMLERQPHPTDTRARSLVLTKHGHAVLKKATKAVSKLDGKIFGKHTNEKLVKVLGAFSGLDQ